MSSMGLGRRLLAMTGRMSIYRGSVVTDPGSIRAIEDDHLDHWRLGRIKLLTSEDKSTWFWLLPARARDALPAGRAGDYDRASPRALAAAGGDAADAALFRQNAAHQHARDRARAAEDRRLHLVVPDRPTPVDMDAAHRPDRGAAVRARQKSPAFLYTYVL
jgi:hypothetical protein